VNATDFHCVKGSLQTPGPVRAEEAVRGACGGDARYLNQWVQRGREHAWVAGGGYVRPTVSRVLFIAVRNGGLIRRRPDLDAHARVCGRMRSPCVSFVSLENGLRKLPLLFYGAPSPTF
jgi:hypothetical protein